VSPLPPVRRSVVVPLAPAAAFDLFVRRIADWWPLASRSVAGTDAVTCFVEVHPGGRVYERTRDGVEHPWGRVLDCDPPHGIRFTWHPGQPEAGAQVVEVTFTADGPRTRVDLEHREWERAGANAEFLRGRFAGGWQPLLERFAALSREEPMLPVEGPGCCLPGR
jgi:uncharacterized protein YndB with AHSA1/START domain